MGLAARQLHDSSNICAHVHDGYLCIFIVLSRRLSVARRLCTLLPPSHCV